MSSVDHYCLEYPTNLNPSCRLQTSGLDVPYTVEAILVLNAVQVSAFVRAAGDHHVAARGDKTSLPAGVPRSDH